uniref:Protein HGH1 homolog n=1 Tax=Culicoides sonorensis TaxID=179676 RepID=A0A336LMG7_CULSO
MDAINELVTFLDVNSRLDLKAVAVAHVLSLTANSEGKNLLYTNDKLIEALLNLTSDTTEAIAKDACRALINISAEFEGAEFLLKKYPSTHDLKGIVQLCFKSIIDTESPTAGLFCMILANLSRHETLVETVIDTIEGTEDTIHRLVTCFTMISYNKKGAKLNYLGPIFSNLSQHHRGRQLICNKEFPLFQRILPFTHHEDDVVRRGGAVGLVKNVCFDSSLHDWLLSPKVDILPYLLLPLAGPEEFDDEDNDKLPVECQYLGADKKREDDPDIRKMLLESLAQLCATRKGREILRDRGTYLILRELHKFECTDQGDPQSLLACENVVDILIRTEDEIGHDNLKEIEIPNESYQKMPPLYAVDDYDQCMNEFKENAQYCVTNIILQGNTNENLWNQIESFSSQEKYHFRHDILRYGFCMNRIRQILNETSIQHKRISVNENPFTGNIRFKQLGKTLNRFNFDVNDENDLESYVGHKFETEYGLKAFSNVSFCISNDNKNEDLPAKNILTSISLRTNINRLLVDQSPNSQLGFLNGIKVVGEAGVVVVHTAYILMAAPTSVPFTIESQMYQPIVALMRSAIFQLQNFFAITAFLSFYPNLTRILKGEKLCLRDFKLLVIKRIVRLWPLIIFVILFNATLLYKLQKGPVWIDAAGNEMVSCHKYWWSNLLFINNFVGASEGPCIQPSWHLAAEMQLFVIELIILMTINRFPNKIGSILSLVVVLGNFATLISLYSSGISGLLLGRLEHTRTRNAFDLEYLKGHIPFYTNTPGYFLGLLAAYLHYQNKQKKIDFSKLRLLLKLWYILFLASGLILWHHSIYVDSEVISFPSLWIAFYSTFCKNIGAFLSITFLIFMANTKESDPNTQGFPIRTTGISIIDFILLKLFNFYNNRVFKILVKLNLGVFLTHIYVAMLIITDGKQLIQYGTQFDMALIGFGTLIGSYIVAAILFVTIEMPIINLFRLFLYRNQTHVEKSSKISNGREHNGDKLD